MVAVFSDSMDDARRRDLYWGDLFVFSPRPATLALVEHAREMIEDAFAGKAPRMAQYELSVDDYLEAEVGHQFHPHQDTWFSAPLAQLNWRTPIYDITPESSMSFHPRYFDEGVKNGSSEYSYYEWSRSGRAVTSSTRSRCRTSSPLLRAPRSATSCAPPTLPAYLTSWYSRTTTWRSTPASSSTTRRSSRRNAVRSSLADAMSGGFPRRHDSANLSQLPTPTYPNTKWPY
jgi:hypothetical protein